MTAEIGNFSLILAAVIALLYGALSIAGAQLQRAPWMALAKPGARALAALLILAFGCLTLAFIQNDFSVLYVAQHSNSRLPLQYRIAGVWGGHEGSLLLWMLMLGCWSLAVSLWAKQLPPAMLARVLGVLGLISAGFLAFILLSSNPFERLLPAAADGRDLNPLLQDIGLIVHPPMLYMGYVGFAVAFAFAVAALLEGRIDAQWTRWARPWTIAAWVCLTLGIALGSAWAYYELGWGGWWFWDPVENASFMPWLLGTALMHSLAVTEKRGSFKAWTLLLAISAFSLSLLGTFLVRSGVLTSVHAFATDPTRGVFILILLALVVGSSLILFAWRAPTLSEGEGFSWVSRESFLLSNNVLLMVFCATVLLGTLYPLIIDSLGLGKLSVGPPYFDAMFIPLMSPVAFLMGIAPFAQWRKASLPDLARTLRWAFVSAAVLALLLPWFYGSWSPLVCLGLLLAIWLALATLLHLLGRVKAIATNSLLAAAQTPAYSTASRYGQALQKLPLSYLGMITAHLGVAAFTAGITLVGAYALEQDVKLGAGQSAALGNFEFKLLGLKNIEGPNYTAVQADVQVFKNGQLVTALKPEKRRYASSPMAMTEAAIDTGWLRDIYVSLGDPLKKDQPNGEWIVRLYIKPFIDWIWGGCVLMALGGLLAMLDRRYRQTDAAKSSTNKHLESLS
jgi:cytochrome c-type biogenesis protein CcmF